MPVDSAFPSHSRVTTVGIGAECQNWLLSTSPQWSLLNSDKLLNRMSDLSGCLPRSPIRAHRSSPVVVKRGYCRVGHLVANWGDTS